mmetsp:Transcript_18771/g.36776  ORF Transcript_18771/g.36776 Transcript_18771/m.36776 type:complete len:98 (+) Transcript_18771:1312-1605(+)
MQADDPQKRSRETTGVSFIIISPFIHAAPLQFTIYFEEENNFLTSLKCERNSNSSCPIIQPASPASPDRHSSGLVGTPPTSEPGLEARHYKQAASFL